MAAVPRTLPIRQYPTPELADIFLLERVSLVVANNDNLQPGTRYVGKNVEQNSRWSTAVYLGQRDAGNDVDVFRVWASDPVRQNIYNFALRFSGEDDDYPIFERTYLVLRDDYLATKPAAASAYSGVYRTRVTAAGDGYRENFAVTATGGAGSGFAGIAIVNADGEVEHVVVIAEGTGYTSAPTLVFTAGSGVGATGVGLVQATACVLTEEKTEPAPNEWNSLYLLATRTFETLPGPWIPDNRDDLLLGPVQRNRRAVLNSGQASALTATGKTTYEGRNGSAIVSWEIVESWSDGTGGAGNPAYPIIQDDFWDEERSDTRRRTQLVTDITTRASLVVSAGTATETIFTGFNQFLRKKIIETWFVPGTARTYNVIGRRGFVASLSRNRVTAGSTPTTQTELIDVERAIEGKDRIREDVITYESGSPLVRKSFNEFGGLDVETDTFVAPGTVPTNVTWTIQELRQEKEKQARLIETVIATGSAISEVENADPNVPGSRATDVYSLVLASTSIPADTSTIVYRRVRFPKNPLLKVEIARTYAIPSSYIESRDMGFGYPTLFTSYYSDNIQGTTIKNRSGFSVVVPHVITHTFSTTRAQATPYQIIENDVTVFSMRIQGLMDAVTAERIVNGVTYSQSIAASTPSKTTYTGLIATAITVGGGGSIWRAGIYDNQSITVILQ